MTAHHKSTEALAHRNALLRWYYSIYPLFGYCCVGTEFFYILLYVHHFFPHPYVYQVSFKLCRFDSNGKCVMLFFLCCVCR